MFHLKYLIAILTFFSFTTTSIYSQESSETVPDRNGLETISRKLISKNPRDRISGILRYSDLDTKTALQNIDVPLPLLFDEDKKVKEVAIYILSDLFIFKFELEEGVKTYSVKPLVRIPSDELYFDASKKTQKAFGRLLQSEKDEKLIIRIIDSIGYIGNLDEGIIDELNIRLHHKNPRIRAASARALGNYLKVKQESIVFIFQLLIDTDEEVRDEALTTLENWGIGFLGKIIRD